MLSTEAMTAFMLIGVAVIAVAFYVGLRGLVRPRRRPKFFRRRKPTPAPPAPDAPLNNPPPAVASQPADQSKPDQRAA